MNSYFDSIIPALTTVRFWLGPSLMFVIQLGCLRQKVCYSCNSPHSVYFYSRISCLASRLLRLMSSLGRFPNLCWHSSSAQFSIFALLWIFHVFTAFGFGHGCSIFLVVLASTRTPAAYFQSWKLIFAWKSLRCWRRRALADLSSKVCRTGWVCTRRTLLKPQLHRSRSTRSDFDENSGFCLSARRCSWPSPAPLAAFSSSERAKEAVPRRPLACRPNSTVSLDQWLSLLPLRWISRFSAEHFRSHNFWHLRLPGPFSEFRHILNSARTIFQFGCHFVFGSFSKTSIWHLSLDIWNLFPWAANQVWLLPFQCPNLPWIDFWPKSNPIWVSFGYQRATRPISFEKCVS